MLLVCSKALPVVRVSSLREVSNSSERDWNNVIHIAVKGWSGNLVRITERITLSSTCLPEDNQQKQLSRKTPTNLPVLHSVTNSLADPMFLEWWAETQAFSFPSHPNYTFHQKNTVAAAHTAHDIYPLAPMSAVHKDTEFEPGNVTPQQNLVSDSEPAIYQTQLVSPV